MDPLTHCCVAGAHIPKLQMAKGQPASPVAAMFYWRALEFKQMRTERAQLLLLPPPPPLLLLLIQLRGCSRSWWVESGSVGCLEMLVKSHTSHATRHSHSLSRFTGCG
jgi:hypothetical protein